MLLSRGSVTYRDVEEMPTFEREWFLKELIESYTDSKTGKVIIPG
jgi:hypothetical protein